MEERLDWEGGIAQAREPSTLIKTPPSPTPPS